MIMQSSVQCNAEEKRREEKRREEKRREEKTSLISRGKFRCHSSNSNEKETLDVQPSDHLRSHLSSKELEKNSTRKREVHDCDAMQFLLRCSCAHWSTCNHSSS